MGPGKFNPKFVRGDFWDLPLSLTNVDGSAFDLTGWTAKSQARAAADDADPVIEFDCTITDEAGGKLDLTADSADTDAIEPGKYVWDVQITQTSTGKIITILSGQMTVVADVTR